MTTDTFGYIGEDYHTWDVSTISEATFFVDGPGGGGADNDSYDDGGPGGYIEATLEISDYDELHIYVAEGGETPDGLDNGVGGWGRVSGSNGDTGAGGGGGMTAIVDPSTDEDIIKSGGGAGGDYGTNDGGSGADSEVGGDPSGGPGDSWAIGDAYDVTITEGGGGSGGIADGQDGENGEVTVEYEEGVDASSSQSGSATLTGSVSVTGPDDIFTSFTGSADLTATPEVSKSREVSTTVDGSADQTASPVHVGSIDETGGENQVIDDFDDQDIGPYSGDTGGFDFYEYATDDYILGSTDGSWNDIFSHPDDGLNYYPQRGETLVCDFHITDDSSNYDEHAIYFGAQDSSNHYRVELNQYQSEFAIYKDQTGDADSASPEASASTGSLLGEYRVEVDWGTADAADDEIVARYYDGLDSDTAVETISTTDAEYDGGGVGFMLWSEQQSGFNNFEAEGEAAPYYELTITDQSPASPEEGDEIDYTVEIENTGEDATDSDWLDLEINGTIEDFVDVQALNAGQIETYTVTWKTEDGDAGDHTADVLVNETEHDTDSTTTTVEVGTVDVSSSLTGTATVTATSTVISRVDTSITASGTASISALPEPIWDVTASGTASGTASISALSEPIWDVTASGTASGIASISALSEPIWDIPVSSTASGTATATAAAGGIRPQSATLAGTSTIVGGQEVKNSVEVSSTVSGQSTITAPAISSTIQNNSASVSGIGSVTCRGELVGFVYTYSSLTAGSTVSAGAGVEYAVSGTLSAESQIVSSSTVDVSAGSSIDGALTATGQTIRLRSATGTVSGMGLVDSLAGFQVNTVSTVSSTATLSAQRIRSRGRTSTIDAGLEITPSNLNRLASAGTLAGELDLRGHVTKETSGTRISGGSDIQATAGARRNTSTALDSTADVASRGVRMAVRGSSLDTSGSLVADALVELNAFVSFGMDSSFVVTRTTRVNGVAAGLVTTFDISTSARFHVYRSSNLIGRGLMAVDGTAFGLHAIWADFTVSASLDTFAEPSFRPAMYNPVLVTTPGEKTPTFEIDLYDEDSIEFDGSEIEEALLTVEHDSTGMTVIEDEPMEIDETGDIPRAWYSFEEGEAFSLERAGLHNPTVTVTTTGGEEHSVPARDNLAIRAGDTPGYQQLSLDGDGIERGLEARDANRTSEMADFDSIGLITADVTDADIDEALIGEGITSGDFSIGENLDVSGIAEFHSNITLDSADLLGDDGEISLFDQPTISSTTDGVDPLVVEDSFGDDVIRAREGGDVDINAFLDIGESASVTNDIEIGDRLRFDSFDLQEESDTLFIDIGQGNYAVRDTFSTGVSNFIWRDYENEALKLGSSSANVQFRGDEVDVNDLDLLNVNSIDVADSVDIGDNTIYASNSGNNSGFSPQDGLMYTQYDDYATIYAYSDAGNVGWRFRDPDGSGNYFRVDNDGTGAFLEGDLDLTGEVLGSAQEWGGYEVQKNGSDEWGVINFKT